MRFLRNKQSLRDPGEKGSKSSIQEDNMSKWFVKLGGCLLLLVAVLATSQAQVRAWDPTVRVSVDCESTPPHWTAEVSAVDVEGEWHLVSSWAAPAEGAESPARGVGYAKYISSKTGKEVTRSSKFEVSWNCPTSTFVPATPTPTPTSTMMPTETLTAFPTSTATVVVTPTVTPTVVVIQRDACPNIEGVQLDVPNDKKKDESGDCTDLWTERGRLYIRKSLSAPRSLIVELSDGQKLKHVDGSDFDPTGDPNEIVEVWWKSTFWLSSKDGVDRYLSAETNFEDGQGSFDFWSDFGQEFGIVEEEYQAPDGYVWNYTVVSGEQIPGKPGVVSEEVPIDWSGKDSGWVRNELVPIEGFGGGGEDTSECEDCGNNWQWEDVDGQVVYYNPIGCEAICHTRARVKLQIPYFAKLGEEEEFLYPNVVLGADGEIYFDLDIEVGNKNLTVYSENTGEEIETVVFIACSVAPTFADTNSLGQATWRLGHTVNDWAIFLTVYGYENDWGDAIEWAKGLRANGWFTLPGLLGEAPDYDSQSLIQ